MTDIVKRLRNPPFGTETSERNLFAQAADEIERLRLEVDRLRLSLDGVIRLSNRDYESANSIARAALEESK